MSTGHIIAWVIVLGCVLVLAWMAIAAAIAASRADRRRGGGR